MRMSSPPSVSSSIKNGGNFAGFNTRNSFTLISISPVGILSFLDKRSTTIPFASTTNSRPNPLANAKTSADDFPSSNIN